MDLKQLEYFVNVVDLGGFSRAARVLGVAQPAISRQIRSLEVELRQNLLLRNGRGAVPTEAGKRLLNSVGVTNANQLFDPWVNSRAAVAIYQAAGWDPWKL